MAVTPGTHVLTGTGKLANVTIAFPGEKWSDIVADGAIVPGAPTTPSTPHPTTGKRRVKQAVAADMTGKRVGIALRTVDIPDINTGPTALGPNEIRNQTINDGEYVLNHYSGSFNLTLVTPRADYAQGQLLTWAEGAARPAGKASGTGAWTNQGATEANAFFEVQFVRTATQNNEVILTVRSVFRQQM